MNIFITGTQSFVGQTLVDQCDRSEIVVTGCDISESPGSRFPKCDIRSKDIAEIIPKNIDALVHLAALSSDPMCRDSAYVCFDVNVMGTLQLIEAAIARNCKQFIFASSEWVYDGMSSPEEKTEESVIDIAKLTSEYALSKLVSEANLRQKYLHGFCDTTILRFGIIYGTRKDRWSAVESIFNSAKNADDVTVGSLKSGRGYIHVKDIANGIVQAIGLKGFNIINLQGEMTSLGNIITTGSSILGTNVSVSETSPDDFNIRRVSAGKAHRLLDWQPGISLEQGLKDLNEIL